MMMETYYVVRLTGLGLWYFRTARSAQKKAKQADAEAKRCLLAARATVKKITADPPAVYDTVR